MLASLSYYASKIFTTLHDDLVTSRTAQDIIPFLENVSLTATERMADGIFMVGIRQ